MRPELLERDAVLQELGTSLAAARSGDGGLAVVSGEAGIGKTSVLREFVATVAGRPRVLWGGCDPLGAPRPFAPLIDAAAEIAPDVADRVASGCSRAEVLAAARQLVIDPDGGATVFVLEDLHWADEATLDLVTYLGRRVGDLPVLLVLTYRDGEVGRDHPLRHCLGEVAGAVRTRTTLDPLSPESVGRLAVGSTVDLDDLYRVTGGNPFYVTEVLGAGGATIPVSVRDAVLARANRLPPDARAVLDAVSVVPGAVERWLLDEMVDVDAAGGLDECIRRGLLVEHDHTTVGFRHELAREAIDDTLDTDRRRALHRAALDVLWEEPGIVDHARLAHHAVGAGDVDAVLAHAPAAADEASRAGAHRAAATSLRHAVRFGRRRPAEVRAELHRRLALELRQLAEIDEGVEHALEAERLYAAAGDVEGRAAAVVLHSILIDGGRGDVAVANARLEEAGALVADRPRSQAALNVAAALVAGHMLARRLTEAVELGRQAIGLAEELGDREELAYLYIQTGTALAMSADRSDADEGYERIRHGMALAGEQRIDSLVALGYTQLTSGAGEDRRYDVAVPAARAGLEFCAERELTLYHQYIEAWLARCELDTGDWERAAERASRLVGSPTCDGIRRFVGLLTSAALSMRRGESGVEPHLDEALDFARSTGRLQRLWPAAACRAEHAWLGDRLAEEIPLVDEVLELAQVHDYRPAMEELGAWRWIHDRTPRGSVAEAVTPFGLVAAGDPAAAALEWQRLGCPYDEAVAHVLVADQPRDGSAERVGATDGAATDRLRTALDIATALGAERLVAKIASALREAGAVVPRGPNSATRANPYALTDRELDVLALVAAGHTNPQIGERLGISPKTAGHHVSSILRKLGVGARAEAAAVFERDGLAAAVTGPSDHDPSS